MKFVVMNLAITYIVACADDEQDGEHTLLQRFIRAIFWPLTVTSWFRCQNGRFHKLLNILWAVLIAGWLLGFISDRL